ncbi:MAG: GNAT family N-acetyltransferase [Acidobacteriota bacterium]
MVRALEVLHAEGLRIAVMKILGEAVYRRLDVVELRLTPPIVVVPEPGFDLRFVTLDDAAAYAELHPVGADEVVPRLERGHRCFGAWQDGRLVATRWFSIGAAPIEYLGRTVPLESGELYLYELYTAPDVRGHSVTRAAGTGAVAALAAEGVHRIVGAVLPENRSVRRAFEKGGWRVVGRIGFVRLGRWRRDFGDLSA